MLGHHYPNAEKSQQLVNYVEDYLECVESLPLDIQRNVSLLREIDAKYQEVLKEVDEVFEKYKGEQDATQRKRLQIQLQRALIISQELGDEKIHVVTQMTELVENRSRQMESHSLCLQEPGETERLTTERRSGVQESPAPERTSARRPRRQRNSESRDSCHPSANGSLADDPVEELSLSQPREKKSKSAKKKKRKAKQERDASPVDFAIDPNEPTYCLCEQVSYGEMIGCDNDQCPIEWFHFSCVGLTYKPKGKWYCPKCRGDNEKTMDKSLDKNRKDRRSR
ncbi:inhibitor of growth protein 2 [Myripristis murdjan]|uniref:Inhibitor of growth protein n=1 Tax=Myripristis murdjan TaxID=586833 RepID=A0A667XZY4_9TELE|nr:inhibitor of growth protein 2 [Myripristis murdjan]